VGSQLTPHAGQQLALFDEPGQSRAHQLDRTVDTIVERFGSQAIGRGSSPRDVND
jgi:hypothetical protein